MASRAAIEASNPLPAAIDERLRSQLRFIIEVDRLKAVLRQSPLACVERLENDAEHSWHLALMVLVLAEHSDETIDVRRTVELVLVHDLVEIYAGDTPLYGRSSTDVDKHQREERAGAELFAVLPNDQADQFHALWDEFEACVTAEARFAKAMDRLEPTLLNWMAKGGTWRTAGVTTDDIRARKSVIARGSASLWAAAQEIIDEGAQRGWSRPRA
jgi:putative hydrolase of HD superfamily